MMLAMGLSYMAFIMLKYVPSTPTLWRVFIINGYWILSKAFSTSVDYMVSIFQFFNGVYHIDLWILKNSCISWVNPIWWWCMILLKCYWNWFASILLRIQPILNTLIWISTPIKFLSTSFFSVSTRCSRLAFYSLPQTHNKPFQRDIIYFNEE